MVCPLLKPVNDTQLSVEHDELKIQIQEILQALPDKRRLAFDLSRFHGMTNKQIALEMGISVKAVESHLTLALHSFRDILKKSEII